MSSLKRLLAVGAILFPLASVACAADADADDEEVGETEDRLLAGRQLSEAEVARHLREAGFPEDQIGRMVCTAKYESTFYEGAINNRNRNRSVDRGLFQINSIHLGSMRGCPSRAQAATLFDAETNTRCALAVFKAQGNRAWYGYRSHKTECDRYPAPPADE